MRTTTGVPGTRISSVSRTRFLVSYVSPPPRFQLWLIQGKDFASPISMVWQMSGGPAWDKDAKLSTATIKTMANRSERISWHIMDFRVSFQKFWNLRRQDGNEEMTVNNSLGASRRLRPVALVGAPQVDVAEAEGTPPRIQHGAVEAEDAFASYAVGRRSKCGEPVVDTRALGIADAGEQMPQSECITLARVNEQNAEQGIALCRGAGSKIESRQGLLERCGSVFHVRRARTDLWARLADGARRDERLVAVELEADPAHGGAQETCAGIVHVQRVLAAEIDGDGGRRIHDKFAGRRPDESMNRAAFERKPLVIAAVCDKTKARVAIDFNLAGFIQRNACSRRTVCDQCLANGKLCRAGVCADRFPSNLGCALQASHIPPRPGIDDGFRPKQEVVDRGRNEQGCRKCGSLKWKAQD